MSAILVGYRHVVRLDAREPGHGLNDLCAWCRERAVAKVRDYQRYRDRARDGCVRDLGLPVEERFESRELRELTGGLER